MKEDDLIPQPRTPGGDNRVLRKEKPRVKFSVCFLHSTTRLLCHALRHVKLKSLKLGARYNLTSFRLCRPGGGVVAQQGTVFAAKAEKLRWVTRAYVVSGVNSCKLSSDFLKHSMVCMCAHTYTR